MARIGPYIIESELGRGGMGVVYRARHAELGRKAALKVLRSGENSEQMEHRFLREAKLMTRVVHANVVRILDFGEVDQFKFIAMELLDGVTLEDMLKSAPLPHRRVLDGIAVGMARGLGSLHAAGIIHRDIKPLNVMITREGVPKVMDLGLARTAEATVLTQAGNVSGTVLYMPPEAGWISDFEPCYDVYQMGLMLHYLYTGIQAFEKPPLSYMMRKEPIPEPAILAMQHELGAREDVIRKCLMTDPLDRYPDGNSLAEELAKAVDPLAARRRNPAEDSGKSTRPVISVMDSPVSRGSGSTSSLDLSEVTPGSAGRILVLACLILGVGIGGWIALPSSAPPDPVATPASPAVVPVEATATPGEPTGPPPEKQVSYLEWLDLSGTVKLEDQLSLGSGSEAKRKLLEEPRMKPFLDELKKNLQDSEHEALVGTYYSDIEYWPTPPVPAADHDKIWIESLERAGQPARLAAAPPGPIRRITLRLRPAEKYRLHLPAGSVEILSPGRYFNRDVTFYEGMDNVTVRHNAMGRPCKVVLVRKEDGLPPPSTIGPEVTPTYMSLVRHNGLRDGEPLTVLLFEPPGPESRLVLGRIKWQKGIRKTLLGDFRNWMAAVDSVRSTNPNLVAEIRGLSTVVSPSGANKSQVDYKDLVIDGKHFAHPDALGKFEELAMSSHEQLRRGGMSVLGMQWPKKHVGRFRAFLAEAKKPDDWIHAVEALSRAGEQIAVDELLKRLGEGVVHTGMNWSRTYVRAIPEEITELLKDPARTAETCSKQGLKLLDQTAAIFGGQLGGDWLAAAPDARLIGADRLSLILALRLIGTPRALKRLDELGKSLEKSQRKRR